MIKFKQFLYGCIALGIILLGQGCGVFWGGDVGWMP